MTTSEKTVFEGPLQQLARSTWQLLLLVGITSIALGVIVLAWPGKTLWVAGVLFGIYLVVSGIGYMFAAFGAHAGAAMSWGTDAGVKINGQNVTISGATANKNCGNASAPAAPTADPQDVKDPYGS